MPCTRMLFSSIPLVAIAACASPEPSAWPSEPLAARAPALVDPTTEFTIPGDAALGLRNDGVSSSYKHKVCGVNSVIFATSEGSSGDAIMDTDNPKFRDPKCANWPRKLTIDYGDGTAAAESPGMLLVHEISNASYSIPLNATVNRAMNFSDARCGGLRWRTHLRDGTLVGGDSVKVTRTGLRTWRVFTDGANNKAWCTNTGDLFNISVDFTITASRDMP